MKFFEKRKILIWIVAVVLVVTSTGIASAASLLPISATTGAQQEGAETGAEEGTNQDIEGETNPGTEEETNPGTEEGVDPGAEEGTNPGTEEGADPGAEEGENPEEEGEIDPEGEEVIEEEEVVETLIANAAEEISVGNAETLILGEEGKYLIRSDGGSTAEVPAEDWDAPNGYYDAGTRVILDGAEAYLRSETTAMIGSISGQSSKLKILDRSKIIVDTTEEYGVDVEDLIVGDTQTPEPVSLTITAATVAVRYGNHLNIGTNANVSAEAGQYGVVYGGERTGYEEYDIRVFEGAELTATATGSDGIAIYADHIEVAGGKITASAPSGVGGIKLTQQLVVRVENGVIGRVEASSDRGRAISVEAMDIMGGDVRGTTSNGEVGIHVNSYMNVYRESENIPFPTVYGSAYSGFGVVVQSIDNGDQEFPSGNISLQEGVVEGYVVDGMGISTNMAHIMSNGSEPSKMLGTAENGIGISACMLNGSSNYYIKGISQGASTNHFQVYNAIPDSAGINTLSHLTLHGEGEVIGEAPVNLPDSFGIHCYLPYESGYISGLVNTYNTSGQKNKITATGHTGLWTASMYAYSEGEMDIIAKGEKDGLVSASINIDSTAKPVNINAVGTTGVGLRIYNEWEAMQSYLSLTNAKMNAIGGQYGMHISTDAEAMITNSVLSGAATGDGAVAGMYFQSGMYPEHLVQKLTVSRSTLHAKSSKIGLLYRDYEVTVDAKDYALAVPGAMEGIGSEIGIGFDYSPEFLPAYQSGSSKALTTMNLNYDGGQYTIRGVSEAFAPDKEGRKAAVALPSASWDGGGLLEEIYGVSAAKPLNSETPYPVYARGMNISDYTGFNWVSSEGTVTAFPEGITLDGAGNNLEVSAERNTNVGSETIALINGTHRILMTVKARLGMAHFNTIGGVPAIESQSVPQGKPLAKPNTVEKEGNTFDGWYDNSQQKLWDFENDVMYGDSLTLDAGWTVVSYNLAFDPNANDESSVEGIPSGITVEYGKTLTEPAPSPTRNNFAFACWALDAAGNEPWNFENMTMPAKEITLYAIWAADEYTVTYHALGGNPDIQTETVKPGETIPHEITEPTWERHLFLGWFEDRDTTIPWNQEALMPSGNLDLYGKWEKISLNIIFDINMGDPASKPSDIVFSPGDTIDLKDFQPGGEKVPQYSGHFFQGWLDASGNVVPVSLELEAKDCVFTAQWQRISIAELPDHYVVYRNTKGRTEIDEEMKTTVQLVDLFDNIYRYHTTFAWDDSVLNNGGMGNIQVAVNNEENTKSIPLLESLKLYVLNKAEITSQEIQTFNFGQVISLNGNEWGASCLVESPDFATQSIKTAPASLAFYLKGTNIREPGIYYPEFIGTYADYFGAPVNVSRTVTAVILPFDSGVGGAIPQREYWTLISNTMTKGEEGTHLFVSAANYKTGGQAILLPLEGYNKRIHARPQEFSLMPAAVLQAVKTQPNAQLQVDLDWLQWYFNSSDFKGENGKALGTYSLEVQKGGITHELVNLGQGEHMMVLDFAMNKSWEGRPTMQVVVTEELSRSAKSGKQLYLFWNNPQHGRLELIGSMRNDGNSRFSTRMSGVYGEYIILDFLPTTTPVLPETGSGSSGTETPDITPAGNIPGNKENPLFVISDKTNPLVNEDLETLKEFLGSKESELSGSAGVDTELGIEAGTEPNITDNSVANLGDITVGKPQEYPEEHNNEEEFPMFENVNMPLAGNYLICCIIIIILLLVIIALQIVQIRLRKKDIEAMKRQAGIVNHVVEELNTERKYDEE